MNVWTLQDAKNRFSAVVEAALTGEAQQVTRRGQPAVVVVSAADYRKLVADAVERRGSFTEHLLDFPGGIERLQARPRDVSF